MTKQSHLYSIGATPRDPGDRRAAAPLRIAVRLWGYDASLAQTWMESLPSLNESLAWTLALTTSSVNTDLMLHMVKPSHDLRAGFCWNCVGANRALARSDSANGNALALFAGHANQLPVTRTGLWIAAGTLAPLAALFRLAHLLAAVTAPTPSGAATVRNEVLGMVARELDVA